MRPLPLASATFLSSLALASPAAGSRGAGTASGPSARTAQLTGPQSEYLALARAGVARAEQRFSDRFRGWYDARLHDRARYPLATIWDIVPLFESLDAIAIAQPTPANRGALSRFAKGAERYLNHGLR